MIQVTKKLFALTLSLFLFGVVSPKALYALSPFTPMTSWPLAYDYNGDGIPDLFRGNDSGCTIENSCNIQVSFARGLGSGKYGPLQDFLVTKAANDIPLFLDYDADGALDYVYLRPVDVQELFPPYTPSYRRTYWLWYRPRGTEPDIKRQAPHNHTWYPDVAGAPGWKINPRVLKFDYVALDLSGDKKPELLTQVRFSADYLLGRSVGKYSPGYGIAFHYSSHEYWDYDLFRDNAGNSLNMAIASDVNGDGHKDLLFYKAPFNPAQNPPRAMMSSVSGGVPYWYSFSRARTSFSENFTLNPISPVANPVFSARGAFDPALLTTDAAIFNLVTDPSRVGTLKYFAGTSQTACKTGDLNLDGHVTGSNIPGGDYYIAQANLGRTFAEGFPYFEGDVTGDGYVGADDLARIEDAATLSEPPIYPPCSVNLVQPAVLENTNPVTTTLPVSNVVDNGYLGFSSDVSGNIAVVSRPTFPIYPNLPAAALNLYVRNNQSQWIQRPFGFNSGVMPDQGQASSTAIFGSKIVMGVTDAGTADEIKWLAVSGLDLKGNTVYPPSHPLHIGSGVYLYRWDGPAETWEYDNEFITPLVSDGLKESDRFGSTFIMRNNYLLIGALEVCRAYLYRFDFSTGWSRVKTFEPAKDKYPGTNQLSRNTSVALGSNDTAIVGCGEGGDQGSGFGYSYSISGSSKVEIIDPCTEGACGFNSYAEVSALDDYSIVTARDLAGGWGSAGLVFSRGVTANNFTDIQPLAAPELDGQMFDSATQFDLRASVLRPGKFDDTITIGIPNLIPSTEPWNVNAGALYIFKRTSSGSWPVFNRIMGSTGYNSYYGWSVALTGMFGGLASAPGWQNQRGLVESVGSILQPATQSTSH